MLRAAVATSAITLGAYGILKSKNKLIPGEELNALDLEHAKEIGTSQKPLPLRSKLLEDLKSTSEYDVLVIGGGATGTGTALDAAARGLKTALVEKYDYASGTSSKSTKLIHGGVRYLQKAVFNLDIEQYKLVKEALHERASMLKKAPHLSDALPIMVPVYKWWQVPYYWMGLKMYDLVAGRKLVKSSYFVGKQKALEMFPMLKSNNLCGAIIYYDGQHNDSRMNLAIALTAIREGATCVNHVEVLDLLKKKVTDDSNQQKEVICGARVRDRTTGDEWDIHAKSVVNATGPFTDHIRKMADPSVPNICQGSAGVHIILPEYYSPKNMGLLDPQTSDGRVIFFLPWEGKTIAGTTDTPCDITFTPKAQEAEIQFILDEVKNYLNPDVHVRRGDVLAAWSGIRPLVTDPSSKDTQSVSRNHVIEISEKKLITIAGGKWTTYRAMAADTVDALVKTFGFPSKQCQTEDIILEGGEGWTPTSFIRLVQDFGLEPEVAKHLSRSYGSKAAQVAKMAKITGKRWPVVGERLVDEFPYIEAEEFAVTTVDMIARRLRLSFLNVQAAEDILPKVVQIMGHELGWDEAKQMEELESSKRYLDEMGYFYRVKIRDVPVEFSQEEIESYTKVFQHFDVEKSGIIVTIWRRRAGRCPLKLAMNYSLASPCPAEMKPTPCWGELTVASLRKVFENLGQMHVTAEQVQSLLSEVDLDMSSTIDLQEFLKLMSGLKTGAVANDRLGALVRKYYIKSSESVGSSSEGSS
eukprot:gene17819-19597_t